MEVKNPSEIFMCPVDLIPVAAQNSMYYTASKERMFLCPNEF